MEQNGFSVRIEAMRQRVQQLYRDSNAGSFQRELLPEALEELEIALEELRLIEDELRQQQTRLLDDREAIDAERQSYQDLFETAPVGYLVTRLDGTIRRANRAAAALLQMTERDLVGRFVGRYVPDGERRLFRARIADLPLSDEPHVLELSMHRGDGGSFEAALTVAVVRGKLGKPLALRWIIQDVTERKQTEAQLRARIAELEQRVSDLQAMPRNIVASHGGEAAQAVEAAQARFAVFADASMQLFAALDGVVTLERVARLLVPAMADLCILDLADDDGGTHRLTVTDGAQSIRRNFPPDQNRAAPAAGVQPELIVQLGEPRLSAIGHDTAHCKLLRALTPAACMIAPLRIHGRTFGTITLVTSTAHRCYGMDDLALAGELARRAALALDRTSGA